MAVSPVTRPGRCAPPDGSAPRPVTPPVRQLSDQVQTSATQDPLGEPARTAQPRVQAARPSRVFLTRVPSGPDDPPPGGSSSSASSPTRPRSRVWSARSPSSSPTSGPSSAPATRPWKPSPRWPMIPTSASPCSKAHQHDLAGNAGAAVRYSKARDAIRCRPRRCLVNDPDYRSAHPTQLVSTQSSRAPGAAIDVRPRRARRWLSPVIA